jgi:hypothetical protein
MFFVSLGSINIPLQKFMLLLKGNNGESLALDVFGAFRYICFSS